MKMFADGYFIFFYHMEAFFIRCNGLRFVFCVYGHAIDFKFVFFSFACCFCCSRFVFLHKKRGGQLMHVCIGDRDGTFNDCYLFLFISIVCMSATVSLLNCPRLFYSLNNKHLCELPNCLRTANYAHDKLVISQVIRRKSHSIRRRKNKLFFQKEREKQTVPGSKLQTEKSQTYTRMITYR